MAGDCSLESTVEARLGGIDDGKRGGHLSEPPRAERVVYFFGPTDTRVEQRKTETAKAAADVQHRPVDQAGRYEAVTEFARRCARTLPLILPHLRRNFLGVEVSVRRFTERTT